MAEHGEVQGKRKRTRALRRAVRRAVRPHAHSHPFELRRKAVQLCLEEGFPVKQVARELGVGFSTLGAGHDWRTEMIRVVVSQKLLSFRKSH